MKGSKVNFIGVLVVIVILQFCFSSLIFSQNLQIGTIQEAQKPYNLQKWRSNEVDAGMSTETVILVGVGIGLAVTAIILLINSSSDDEMDGEKNDPETIPDDENDEVGLSSLFHYDLKNDLDEHEKENTLFNIYLNIKKNNLQFSDNTFEIGLAFNF